MSERSASNTRSAEAETVSLLCRREGNRRSSLRKVLTAWDAEQTREKVSKK